MKWLVMVGDSKQPPIAGIYMEAPTRQEAHAAVRRLLAVAPLHSYRKDAA